MQAHHGHLVYMNDDMYCLPGWDTALQRRAATMRRTCLPARGTMVEPRDSGNLRWSGPYGDAVDNFRRNRPAARRGHLARADWCGAT